jgi:hypothetical protein
MREEFVRDELPKVARTMRLLDFGIDEFVEQCTNGIGEENDEK